MDFNLHTHTNHSDAVGSAEEYVLRAIECGVKTLGFTDHTPFMLPNGYQSAFRIPVKNAKVYVEKLTQLKEKYKDKIEILIGSEVEYYPEYFNNTFANLKALGVEFLILGQHFVFPETSKTQHVVNGSENKELLCEYVNRTIEGMKTKKFTYVAHPDMYLFFGDETFYKEQMRKICVASRELNIPLEINFMGIRSKRFYPNEVFWQIAKEENSPVTLGTDAHNPLDVYDKNSLNVAKNIIEKYSLNYIGKPNVIKI